jgi:hypothetical protein
MYAVVFVDEGQIYVMGPILTASKVHKIAEDSEITMQREMIVVDLGKTTKPEQ